MMFLDEASPRRSRLQKFREYLLLGLRCAAVLALVVAMARPVMIGGSGWASTGGGVGDGWAFRAPGRAALAVIVDTSGSTGMPTGPGAVRLDQIRETVGRLLSSLSDEDVAALVVEGNSTQFTADRGSLLARLSALRPAETALDLPHSLQQAARLLGGQGASHRLIAVVTDRQAVNADALTDEVARRFAALREELGIQRVLVFVVGDTDRDNVAVREIDVLDSPVLEGRPVRLRVTLRNYGETPRPGLPVRVRLVGGEEVSAAVDLAAESEGSVVVPMRFGGPGRAVVSAEITPAGPPFDDRLLRVVDVGQPTRVLVVDGSRPAGDGGGLVPLALAPLASAGRAGDTIVAETATEVPRFDLERYSVVVIPQLQALSNGEATALRQFVHAGGGLVMGAGPLTTPAVLSELEGGGPGGSLVPARVEGVGGGGGGTRVELASALHPVARGVANPADVFPGLSVGRFRVLVPGREATVVLRLTPEVPLMVEGRFGRGRVLLCAFPLEGLWSDMTRSVGYVPWIQAVVRHAALPPPDAVNLRVGETLVTPLRAGALADSVSLAIPGGQTVSLEAIQTSAGTVVRYGPVLISGLYELRYRLEEGDATSAAVAEAVYVRPPEAESDLRADDAAWESAALRIGGELRSAGAIPTGEAGRMGDLRYEQELWLPVLLAAVGLLVMELVLTRVWRI
jgi:hypothetical protein